MEQFIDALNANASEFNAILRNCSEELRLFREAPGKWNIHEIACHLLDEEMEDFRMRLKLILESPGTPFPAIDPVAWVESRNYAFKNYNEVVIDFLLERSRSIEWLRGLKNPAWDNFYEHPKAGPLSAKFMLANWLAHDYLHLRQIIRIKYHYLKKISGENLDYAGQW